jgi:hypothetical protein
MKPCKFLFAAALALSSIALAACSTVIPVQSNYSIPVYERGSLVFTLQNPIDKVAAAVEKALKDDLRLGVDSVAKDAICAEYTARTAQGQRVLVRLNYNTDKSTIIDIRVGLIGEEAVSRQILDAVRTRL